MAYADDDNDEDEKEDCNAETRQANDPVLTHTTVVVDIQEVSRACAVLNARTRLLKRSVAVLISCTYPECQYSTCKSTFETIQRYNDQGLKNRCNTSEQLIDERLSIDELNL